MEKLLFKYLNQGGLGLRIVSIDKAFIQHFKNYIKNASRLLSHLPMLDSVFKSTKDFYYLVRNFATRLVRYMHGEIRLLMLVCQHYEIHLANYSFSPYRFNTYYRHSNWVGLAKTYSKITTQFKFLHTFKYILNVLRGIHLSRLNSSLVP